MDKRRRVEEEASDEEGRRDQGSRGAEAIVSGVYVRGGAAGGLLGAVDHEERRRESRGKAAWPGRIRQRL